MSARPSSIILVAHGERGGAGNDRRLTQLADQVSDLLDGRRVQTLLLSDAEGLKQGLAAEAATPSIVLPLLFSDGFFYAERLLPALSGLPHRAAPPLVDWDGFVDMLADEQSHRLEGAVISQTVLLAHGSRRPGRSAACARQIAGDLSSRLGRVETGFLEESPLAKDVCRQAPKDWAAIGLFLGDGLHGREDFGQAIEHARSPAASAFTVGQALGLPGLVAARARLELAAAGEG